MKTNFYDYKAKSMQGDEVNMAGYQGKVVLIVNTASKCGFTPQFEGLETLYEKYKERGLVILGFPTNQFAKQDPGANEEILEFCQLNYGVTFPMFEKIEVNGKNTTPLFRYLKKAQPGNLGKRIKWNFTKFLIDKTGTPVRRYGPTVKPDDLEEDIVALLT